MEYLKSEGVLLSRVIQKSPNDRDMKQRDTPLVNLVIPSIGTPAPFKVLAQGIFEPLLESRDAEA